MQIFYIIDIPKRSTEGLPDISLLSLIITFNYNIAQDHKIGQMLYLEGQITIKGKPIILKLLHYPLIFLGKQSDQRLWMLWLLSRKRIMRTN